MSQVFMGNESTDSDFMVQTIASDAKVVAELVTLESIIQDVKHLKYKAEIDAYRNALQTATTKEEKRRNKEKRITFHHLCRTGWLRIELSLKSTVVISTTMVVVHGYSAYGFGQDPKQSNAQRNQKKIDDFQHILLATLIGNVFLCLIACLVSYIACKTGLTFALMTRYSFGEKGSRIASFFVPIVNLGWYTIQAATYGHFVATVLHCGQVGEYSVWH